MFGHAGIVRRQRFLTAALLLWVVADAGSVILAAPTVALPGLPDILAWIAAFTSYRPLSTGRFGRTRDAIDFTILARGVLALTWPSSRKRTAAYCWRIPRWFLRQGTTLAKAPR